MIFLFNKKKESNLKAYTIRIFGIVQGVGFRPYVYNLAYQYNIKGLVNNSGAALVIHGEGSEGDLKEFIQQIIQNPPGLAKIEKISISSRGVLGYQDFEIIKSDVTENSFRFVAGDVGVCPECIEEVLDFNSRFYLYPFTNCTKCGPRYSIIEDLPYDRKNTTMKSFNMCPDCREDYKNPINRRFHAQPICCPSCGPAQT